MIAKIPTTMTYLHRITAMPQLQIPLFAVMPMKRIPIFRGERSTKAFPILPR